MKVKQKEEMTSRCNYSMPFFLINGKVDVKKIDEIQGKNECERAKTLISIQIQMKFGLR